MNAIKYLSCIICLIITISTQPQDHSILIFDPNDVSASFQSTLSQLTDDSVFVADTLDDSILNYDAAFLFFDYSYLQSASTVSTLINYTSTGRPIYLFTIPFVDSVSSPFWNYIGLNGLAWLATATWIDYVTGIDTAFTKGIIIDTSFMSWSIPATFGTMAPILVGESAGPNIQPTYISSIDTLTIILDLYNLIDDIYFLQRVLVHFGLIPPSPITVLSPNGGEHYLMGDQTVISWSSNDIDSVKIELSVSDGIDWITIVESTPNDGSFDWIVQAPIVSWYCKMKISDVTDSTVFDDSDNTFVIDIFPSVEDSLSLNLPKAYTLSQNYPNPFNPSTKIKFEIPFVETHSNASLQVTLKVYDVLGNEVATLVNEEKQPGSYEVEFSAKGGSASGGDAYNLPSGIYFYQLSAGNFLETKKMILIK